MIDITKYPIHVFLKRFIIYYQSSISCLLRYCSQIQYAQEFPCHVCWKMLIPYSRLSKLSQTDLQDCSLRVFSKQMRLYRIKTPSRLYRGSIGGKRCDFFISSWAFPVNESLKLVNWYQKWLLTLSSAN